MKYSIKPMDAESARQACTWRFPPPYDIYSESDNPESMAELLSGSYHAAYKRGQMAGYFCFGEAAQVPAGLAQGLYTIGRVDIGLAMRPDLTGKGRGLDFFKAGIAYARELFPDISPRLTVASFNKRAIKVYERAGFVPVAWFAAPNGTEFMIMNCKN